MLRRFFSSFLVFLFVGLGLPIFFFWFVFQSLSLFDFEDGRFNGLLGEMARGEVYDVLRNYSELEILDDEELFSVIEVSLSDEVVGDFLLSIGRQLSSNKMNDGDLVFDIGVNDLLLSEGGLLDGLAMALFEKLPVCGQEVVGNLYICVIKGVSVRDFSASVRADFDRRWVSQINDTVTLSLPFNVNVTLAELFLSFYVAFMWIGLTALCLVFVALLFVVYRPWDKVLKWSVAAILGLLLPIFLFLTALVYFPDLMTVVSSFDWWNIKEGGVLLFERFLQITFLSLALEIWHFVLGLLCVFVLAYFLIWYLNSRNDT